MDSDTALRYGNMDDGKRYVARNVGHRAEHAVWVDGSTQWMPHRQAGIMAPFEGPDDVYEHLTEGGLHLWRPCDTHLFA